MPLRIQIKEGRTWREVENGPFPLTLAQLTEARARFKAEFDAAKPLHGARHAPQTAARAILREVVPSLSDFDALMVGFAVTSAKIQTEEETGLSSTNV